MEPSIQDGDLLLIEPGNRWENKDIVIAWVDGEVTCKRLQMNHSPALLVPDNRDYKVIQVSDEALILGRVVGRYEAFINGWKP
jgi:SOS-response transcriptional repressor LexA